MPTLNLNRKEVEVLTVNIDEKSYNIPLGTSLKPKELAKLNTQDAVMKFLETYLGKELTDDLSVGEIKQIVEAWSEATKKASGVTLGES